VAVSRSSKFGEYGLKFRSISTLSILQVLVEVASGISLEPLAEVVERLVDIFGRNFFSLVTALRNLNLFAGFHFV